ncbi:hypothetical protein GCM10027432_00600 [Lysobacter fragariae]
MGGKKTSRGCYCRALNAAGFGPARLTPRAAMRQPSSPPSSECDGELFIKAQATAASNAKPSMVRANRSPRFVIRVGLPAFMVIPLLQEG